MISAAELTSLATSHDIISIGMLADDLRRERHGAQTTFVRVASTPADEGAPVSRPPAAGETDLGLAFLADTASGEPGSRWPSYAQVLLSAHEFRQIQ